MPKLTNKEIEDIAIEHIKKIYPNAKPATAKGYDLKIGSRLVEVKATTSKKYRQNIFFSREHEHNLFKNNKKNYWLFRVYNVGKPKSITLKEIRADQLEAVEDPRWRVKIAKGV
jgi:Domain of unknown function (DUF3883)